VAWWGETNGSLMTRNLLRILVTGAGGLLGSELSGALAERGHAAICPTGGWHLAASRRGCSPSHQAQRIIRSQNSSVLVASGSNPMIAHARPVLLRARMQRTRDGTLSNGTPDWRPATRSDGNGVGAENRLKFSCQPTIVGRPSMTAAQAVPCPPLSALETA
jgi:hypothetical protein